MLYLWTLIVVLLCYISSISTMRLGLSSSKIIRLNLTKSPYIKRAFTSCLPCNAVASSGASIPSPIDGTKPTTKTTTKNNGSPLQGLDEIKAVRLSKLQQLRDSDMNPFAYKFEATHKTTDLHNLCADLPNGEENLELSASVCGRIMIRRVFGKLAFFQLQDENGTIQLYLDKTRLPGDSFDKIKTLTDSGDIIGVKGTLKRTDKVYYFSCLCVLQRPITVLFHITLG